MLGLCALMVVFFAMVSGAEAMDPVALNVFSRTSSGALAQQQYRPGTGWSSWAQVGPAGAITGDPSAVSEAPNSLDVYARGTSGQLVHNVYREDGQGWRGWTNEGENGVLAGDPSAVAFGPGFVDIFARRAGDNMLIHRQWRDATGWTGWVSMGITIPHDPVAVASGTDTDAIDVFWRGADNHLYDEGWSQQFGWTPSGTDLGGSLAGDPAPTSWGQHGRDIFARSTDGHLVQLEFRAGTGWTDWITHDETLSTDPGAVASYAEAIDVFARDAGGSAMQQTQHRRARGWSPWTPRSGADLVGTPSAASWATAYHRDPGADFNHDGISDITLQDGGGTLAQPTAFLKVLLGDIGQFELPGPYRSGIGASNWQGVGDFNNDGISDVALLHDNQIDLLLSDGSQFQYSPAALTNVGAVKWAKVGDFNRDGIDDIAMQRGNNIDVALGNITGFTQPATWRTGIGTSRWQGVGDFNRDGISDIAFQDGANIDVLLGDLGQFEAAGTWRGGMGNFSWGEVGDFNNDNIDDIAVQQGANIDVLLGDIGQFEYAGTWRGGIGTTDWAGVGDFNDDGIDDLVLHDPATSSMGVLLGNISQFEYSGVWRSSVAAFPWAGPGDFAIDETNPTASISGGLHDAANSALTDGSLTVSADDDRSGVAKIQLYDHAGNTPVGAAATQTCWSKNCPTSSLTLTTSLDPDALGWATGAHQVDVVVTDNAGNTATTSWTVNYYKTSWDYGGADHVVTGGDERAALALLMSQTSDPGPLWSGLTSAEQDHLFDGGTIGLVDDSSTTGSLTMPDPIEYGLLGAPADGATIAALQYGCRKVSVKKKVMWRYPLFPDVLVGYATMHTSFCWNQRDHRAVWESKKGILDIDPDVNGASTLAQWNMAPEDPMYHYQETSPAGWPSGQAHMEIGLHVWETANGNIIHDSHRRMIILAGWDATWRDASIGF
ncbi:MAG TPA: FG-GAP-like repeat-containing protein [Baekduia sp.]